MSFYQITSLAEADIDQIFNYIAQGSLFHAYRWLNQLHYQFELLILHPFANSYRERYGKNVRFKVFGRYLILYHPHTHPIRILRVVNGCRDPSKLLGLDEE